MFYFQLKEEKGNKGRHIDSHLKMLLKKIWNVVLGNQ